MRIEDLFSSVNFIPNNAQLQAIKHIEGPLYLLAGPGSGKTRVLLWRTVNLIVFHEVKLEEIFLSTFTEKAAENLRSGLISLLGVATENTGIHYDISGMYIGTVHSLCKKFVLDNRLKNSLKRKLPIVMDELEQYLYLYDNKFLTEASNNLKLPEDFKDIIKEYMGLRSSSKYELVSTCISVFNRFSEEGIKPEQIINSDSDEAQKILAKLYEFYLYKLSSGKKRMVDFSLLQQYGYEVLCESVNSGEIFKYVMLDEYQDTNNIQEKIFFKLSQKYKNICVVGDADQSLYRFRGATVENFVQFDKRCMAYLGKDPRKIKLNINYRSRKKIVDFYTSFMDTEQWENKLELGKYYRNKDKNIVAYSKDEGPSVVKTLAGKPVDVYFDIANKLKEIIDEKVVSDPSEITVLFTYLKGNQNADRFKSALNDANIKVYAPRAGRFLDNEEPMALFGIYLIIFGKPEVEDKYNLGKNKEFYEWLDTCYKVAVEIVSEDINLKNFICKTKEELKTLSMDYEVIKRYIHNNSIDLEEKLGVQQFRKFKLSISNELSDVGKKEINKGSLEGTIRKKVEGNNAPSYSWIISRVNSLDWNLLDLFYKICGFNYFKEIFNKAELGIDEAPIYNLSNITHYIGMFIEKKIGLITGKVLDNDIFVRTFFVSYLGGLFRKEEGECELNDQPIPKGRISFLTIHQSKGLEFPVVVLGALPPVKKSKNKLEEMVRPYLNGEYEPLDKISEFDRMRSFYVALSRAENLLILPHFKGRGQSIHPNFKMYIEGGELPLLNDLDLNSIPKSKGKSDSITKVYSYTSDYLSYNDCPRKYMIYRKYAFVPARTTISFFGNLVHRTLEDIHNHFINIRNEDM